MITVPFSHIDSTDYSPVNLELTFDGEPFQGTVAMFNITIAMDDIDEPVEEFYLNVIPDNNDIVLTPRITVRILDGEWAVLTLSIYYSNVEGVYLQYLPPVMRCTCKYVLNVHIHLLLSQLSISWSYF